MAAAWAYVRAATALLIVVALGAQLAASTAAAAERGWDVGMTVANFFSLFSVQANLLVAVVLTVCVGREWSGRAAPSSRLETAVACATTYAIWTAVIYNFLLRRPPRPEGTRVIWSNEVVHLIVPLILVVVLLFGPRLRALRWRAIRIIPLYPVLWAIYTVVRGPLTPNPRNDDPYWYPYAFFDPYVTPGGPAGVGVRLTGIAIAIFVVGVLVVWVARWRAGRGRPARPDAGSAVREGAARRP